MVNVCCSHKSAINKFLYIHCSRSVIRRDAMGMTDYALWPNKSNVLATFVRVQHILMHPSSRVLIEQGETKITHTHKLQVTHLTPNYSIESKRQCGDSEHRLQILGIAIKNNGLHGWI